ncbi:uncharacterized protein SPPG_02934 [Spizellomyces punctatus DAOM BR117]|uniref:Uncharacterized protein n=1 Tax=Spizellomyces punctatus (strain DAOM BR117) TaxID=645134 RepID=A0A0L0HN00_SPIPD|nr:uncharacterized protein SPPG_02934 [Spizellomyces punctatus DAOM BR117]KND02472.1 hypothetical protein SPPG_02934 [Spizellomyces punctatus DAOM BR117]|eukprot:XP_016610511.1 hypothetical protein SPPG_02934 [Spizellomyces punctatus DAOM BR117]
MSAGGDAPTVPGITLQSVKRKDGMGPRAEPNVQGQAQEPIRKRRKTDRQTENISDDDDTSAAVPEGPLPATPAASVAETLLAGLNDIPHAVPAIDPLPPLPAEAFDVALTVGKEVGGTSISTSTATSGPTTSTTDRSNTLVRLLQPLTEPPLVPHIRARRAPTSYRRRKPQVNYPAAKPPYLLDRPPPSVGYRVYPGFPAFLQQVTPRNQVTAGEAHRNPVSARFVDRRWWVGGGGAPGSTNNNDGGGNLAADAAVEEELSSLGHGQEGAPSEQDVEWQARAAAAAAAAAAARVAGVAGFGEIAAFGGNHDGLFGEGGQQVQAQQGAADGQVSEARDLLGMLLMAANGEA